ncbi:MAG TPA: histidinol-phosphate transaminase [Candidatus Dormibacteraeota bacterium]|nr:histidinol-phosphate transaminase [Candidatus Dormibacteraeota bacterium]
MSEWRHPRAADWRQTEGTSKLEAMTRPLEDLIPEYLRGLPVYVPGKPIEEVERELNIRAIKLASNENPLGPSPKAVEAVRGALPESHRYPDGGTNVLREKLAKLRGVQFEEIFIGLGSSEIIDLAARVFLRFGIAGLTSEGSYAPFSTAIRASGAALHLAKQRDFAFDLRAIGEAITPETRLIYLANPNNPTGTAFGAAELEQFLERVPQNILVVLDEAYIHYAARADMPDSAALFRAHKNLLTLRTFSKVYGLAGLRIGYATATSGLVAAMNKLRTPFNTSGLAQAAAIAALDDDAHVKRSLETNAAERLRLHNALRDLGLQPVPSEANFIFVELGAIAKDFSDVLLRGGVIVRPLGWMGFPDAIRVSVGTAQENDAFLQAMRELWPNASRATAAPAQRTAG